MNQSVSDAVDGFVHQLLQKAQFDKKPLLVEYDPQWPSPCVDLKAKAGELVVWQPVRQTCDLNWTGLETALELDLHPSIKHYYQCYWSDHLSAKHSFGMLELIQVWSEADFDRLQQNLIGHILMKRRLKQAETIFFALTDEDDEILCIDNQSGQVVLEQVGLPPKKVIAEDLSDFIISLEPQLKSYEV